MSSVHVELQHPELVHFPNHDSSDRGRNWLYTRPVYNAKWMQVLNQYHAAAPPFVCVTLVRIGRSANVREFSLLVHNPSVASAISMVSHFWNICHVMSSPEVLRSRKHLGFADYGRGGTSVCSCAIHSERWCAGCDAFVCVWQASKNCAPDIAHGTLWLLAGLVLLLYYEHTCTDTP